MKSRILFLGTGGDAFVIGKQYRASGGIIFVVDENQFHINPGPGSLVMAKMMGLNLRENTAIFISKNDIYHANDVNAVISAMTHEGLDKRGVLVCPSSVANEAKETSPFLNKNYKKCIEKIIVVDNTTKLAINHVDVEIVQLKEQIKDACGFKFITPKFTLGYIPDTGYVNNLGENYHDCDILIMTVVDPRSVQRKNHLNSEDAEKIISKASPQLAILTGFGTKMLQAETLYEAREIQKNTGVQVVAAKDGMTINPVNFAATVRQKNLKGF